MTLTVGEALIETEGARDQQIMALRSLQRAVCLRDPEIGKAFGSYYLSFEQVDANGNVPFAGLRARNRQAIREHLRAYGDFVTGAYTSGW